MLHFHKAGCTGGKQTTLVPEAT